MKKETISLIIFSLAFTLSTLGQNVKSDTIPNQNRETQSSQNNTIRLQNSSNIEESIINIRENTQALDLTISSRVYGGKLTIELYSPDGTLEGNLTLGNLLNDNKKEISQADIRKSLIEPQAGYWKVKIIPTNAFGSISIRTSITQTNYYLNVPKDFSPNGDNINDELELKTSNLSDSIDFKLFNRWGNLVFESQITDFKWDGKKNGEVQPKGVYYFVIRAKTLTGFDIVENGTIYLTN